MGITREWPRILRDIVIVYGLTMLGGYLLRYAGVDIRDTQRAYTLASYSMGILGFTIVGCLAREPRYKQLGAVALGSWVVSLVNVFIAPVSLFMWAVGLIQIVIMAAIGGGLSYGFTWVQRVIDANCPTPKL